jgi:cell division protein ZapA
MPSAETVKVTIFNQTYSLRSMSGAEHIRGIAHLVDERMKHIASNLATHDISKIAILVAMNIADEMQSLKAHYESEIERLNNPSVVETTDENDNAPLRPESERASWFDEIFEADMPARDRAERLSTQVSAKLQARRKIDSPEPTSDGTED